MPRFPHLCLGFPICPVTHSGQTLQRLCPGCPSKSCSHPDNSLTPERITFIYNLKPATRKVFCQKFYFSQGRMTKGGGQGMGTPLSLTSHRISSALLLTLCCLIFVSFPAWTREALVASSGVQEF